jgi:tRNA(Ile)-lysidine synthase
MKVVGAEAEVVGGMAQQWLKKAGRDGPPGRPRTPQRGVPAFAGLPLAVQRRGLQWQLAELGVAADFELVERLRRFPDVAVSVGPNFFVARNVAGRVTLRAQPPIEFKVRELIVNLAGRAGEVSFAGVHFRWSRENVKGAGCLSPRARRELFDADKVGGQITLRHWQAGDRFQPIGLKSAVKLQDLFTNQKIPRARRRNLIVAEAVNGRIFWVEQLRMAEPFKLTPATKRRLIWRWQGNAG